MYELLVLGLLMHFPLYAYLITDIADQIIGPWERISRGNISVLLRKLEQDACIEPANPSEVPFPSDRSSRVFAITPVGRDRFYRLMVDTTSNQGIYQRLFRIKALHLEFLEPQDQRYLVEHYLTYCQTTLRYLQTEGQDFATDPRKQKQLSGPFRLVVQEVIELKARQCELEIAWATLLRERFVSAPLSKEENQQ